ncbi:ABC transporter permease [Kineosporia sp. J2-2]|uniref:ABC transporter permease n=1 Tax=Kineosporia corallincola TaxID=2835133 RepID=A0ABS5TC84_9ACTN|nr:ABC transporter permease [Kineosporia corallincola]MBT0768697.1 ABC transporter permease [Kineosporia corallincola]
MPGSPSNPQDAGRTSRPAPLRAWARSAVGLIAYAAAVTLAVILLSFGLSRAMPGDALSAQLGSHATEQTKQQLAAQLGLDQPWWRQLARLLGNLITHGDVGPSLINGESVRSAVTARAGATLSIVALALVIAVVAATVLAVIAATHQNRWPDHLLRIVLSAGIAVPAFWLGLLLILAFSVHLHWFPVAGLGTGPGERLRSLVLPAVTAAVGIVPLLARSLRAQLLEVINADFVVAARATGLSPARIIARHLVPNAALPALTLLGTNLAYLIGGTFVVESVFTIPGVGDLMFRSITNRDSTTITGIVIYTAVLVVIVNLLTDLAVRLLDPRQNRRGAAL